MIEIPLTKGFVAIVDDEDAHLAALRWFAKVTPRSVYAKRTERLPDGRKASVYLHKQILQVPPGVEVDHISGDGLDCRRSNLRPASDSQNQQNQRRRRTNRSGFKGVSWDASKNKWRADIKLAGKHRFLGLFINKEAAARAYDAAAQAAFGEFARPNFPAVVA